MTIWRMPWLEDHERVWSVDGARLIHVVSDSVGQGLGGISYHWTHLHLMGVGEWRALHAPQQAACLALWPAPVFVEAMVWSLRGGAALSLLIGFLVVLKLLTLMGIRRKPRLGRLPEPIIDLLPTESTAKGSARWATLSELRAWELPPRARRTEPVYYLGRPVTNPEIEVGLDAVNQYKNVLAIASAGGGKTTLVQKNLLMEEGDASGHDTARDRVLTDAKGTLYAKTAGHLADRGWRCISLNFLPDAETPDALIARYNPLVRASRGVEQAQVWARGWVQNAPVGALGASSDVRSYYENMGTDIIAAFVLLLAAQHERDGRDAPDLIELRREVTRADLDGIVTTLRAACDDAEKGRLPHGEEILPVLEQGRDTMQGVVANAARQAGYVTSIQRYFTCVSNPRVRRVIRGHDLPLEDMGERRTAPLALYVTFDVQYRELLQQLVGSVYGEVIDILYSKANRRGDSSGTATLERPCVCDIDEAGVIRIPGIEHRIVTVREARVAVNLYMQNMEQGEILYGAYWGTVLGGTQTRLALGAVHPDDARIMTGEGWMGTETLIQRTTSVAAKRRWAPEMEMRRGREVASRTKGEWMEDRVTDVSDQVVGRPLLEPIALTQQPLGTMTVMRAGATPFRTRWDPWQSDPELSRRAALPPPRASPRPAAAEAPRVIDLAALHF